MSRGQVAWHCVQGLRHLQGIREREMENTCTCAMHSPKLAVSVSLSLHFYLYLENPFLGDPIQLPCSQVAHFAGLVLAVLLAWILYGNLAG